MQQSSRPAGGAKYSLIVAGAGGLRLSRPALGSEFLTLVRSPELQGQHCGSGITWRSPCAHEWGAGGSAPGRPADLQVNSPAGSLSTSRCFVAGEGGRGVGLTFRIPNRLPADGGAERLVLALSSPLGQSLGAQPRCLSWAPTRHFPPQLRVLKSGADFFLL